jgi:hypothetical protein
MDHFVAAAMESLFASMESSTTKQNRALSAYLYGEFEPLSDAAADHALATVLGRTILTHAESLCRDAEKGLGRTPKKHPPRVYALAVIRGLTEPSCPDTIEAHSSPCDEIKARIWKQSDLEKMAGRVPDDVLSVATTRMYREQYSSKRSWGPGVDI